MWHKGVRWHHVESDILKEGPGTETSWVWGIVEHQIPSIKVLFKTNAKSHKHPSIKLLSSESKTQLVSQRKQNSYRRTYIYIYIYKHRASRREASKKQASTKPRLQSTKLSTQTLNNLATTPIPNPTRTPTPTPPNATNCFLYRVQPIHQHLLICYVVTGQEIPQQNKKSPASCLNQGRQNIYRTGNFRFIEIYNSVWHLLIPATNCSDMLLWLALSV